MGGEVDSSEFGVQGGVRDRVKGLRIVEKYEESEHALVYGKANIVEHSKESSLSTVGERERGEEEGDR